MDKIFLVSQIDGNRTFKESEINDFIAVAKELECFRSSEEELKTTIKTLIKLI